VSSHADGLAVMTVGGWPGGWAVYPAGDGPGPAFLTTGLHGWRRWGLKGNAATVQVLLEDDGTPARNDQALGVAYGRPSRALRLIHVYGVPHGGAAAAFVILPAAWLALRLRRRRLRRPGGFDVLTASPGPGLPADASGPPAGPTAAG
jgi:hypothetical protein